MHYFKVVLMALADWLLGCSHRRTSFPITRRTSVGVDGQRSTREAETYIVCRECARHFEYDWTTMRITGQPATAASASRLDPRGVIGGTAVIVKRRTRAIVDLRHNVLNSSGM